ncbi:calcium/sodium antiporter [Thermoproteota archaeon]
MIIIDVVLFFFSFFLLWLGAHVFIDGTISIAKRFRLSDLLTGLTLVAVGTSAPEFFVNVFASIMNKPDIVIGNILGSNIINILIAIGLAGVIFPIAFRKASLKISVWYNFLSIPFVLLLLYFPFILQSPLFSFLHLPELNFFMGLGRINGFFMISAFLGFLYISVFRSGAYHPPDDSHHIYSLPMGITLFIIGLVLLPIASRLVVDSGSAIAQAIGISEALIALFAIALGTSLPEIITSLVAAFKKRSDMAVGNIIGSNLFNIYLVLGVCSFINPIRFHSLFLADILLLMVINGALAVFVLVNKKGALGIKRASCLLLIYAFYLIFLFIRG